MPTKFQVDISNGAAVIVDMFFAPPAPPQKKDFSLYMIAKGKLPLVRPEVGFIEICHLLPFVTMTPPPVSTLNKTPIYRAPRGK